MRTFIELKKAAKKVVDAPKTIKVAVLGDSATQLLAISIKGEGAVRGLNLDVWEAAYNQVERQIFEPQSDYHQFKPDYTVIFQSTHKLVEKHAMCDPEQKSRLADDRLQLIEALCSQACGRIIYYNYPEIDDTVFGSYGAKVEDSLQYQLAKLNFGLMELAKAHSNLFVCNLSGISAKYGRNFMFEPASYINTDSVLSVESLPLVAARTVDVLAAVEGYFKKCLILDLDNTLWGGIVGDDGWEGIQIGHGLGLGSAFTEFQQWIKKLKERGVIICICSKNDEQKAKQAFEKNPEMILRLDDIAVFMANWNNKADNIKAIKQILNIGYDSMVFIDDNPFERNLVRQKLPEITVPEMPEDPAEYLEFLYGENLFETASHSRNDNDRTKQYQNEARRVASQMEFSNAEDYLASLEMKALVDGPNAFNIPRIAQLSQRSNQFNLRTIRYTEDDIKNLASDSKTSVMAFSLSDKYGDNGLVSVVILKPRGEDAMFIDTWLMSCRVLNRTMEQFVINQIVREARSRGARKIIGEYIPTPKNSLVENLLPSLGFIAAKEGQGTAYELDLTRFAEAKTCIAAQGNDTVSD